MSDALLEEFEVSMRCFLIFINIKLAALFRYWNLSIRQNFTVRLLE